jgi:hypothetical protein
VSEKKRYEFTMLIRSTAIGEEVMRRNWKLVEEHAATWARSSDKNGGDVAVACAEVCEYHEFFGLPAWGPAIESYRKAGTKIISPETPKIVAPE